MEIPLKTEAEIDIMRRNGALLGTILKKLQAAVRPDVTTLELDKLASELILGSGAIPSFRGYQGYPATLCTSINEQVVHALPSKRKLKEGDIITLDLGLKKDGFHVDAAVTVLVEPVSADARNLVSATKQALKEALKKVKEGVRVGIIGATIQQFIEKRGYAVIKDLTGHGVGRDLHEPPQILNFGRPSEGPVLKSGMTLAIEPMASLGAEYTRKDKDGFAYITTDNSLSAHWEVTVLVTPTKAEILTPGII